jgi:hypothetical protein
LTIYFEIQSAFKIFNMKQWKNSSFWVSARIVLLSLLLHSAIGAWILQEAEPSTSLFNISDFMMFFILGTIFSGIFLLPSLLLFWLVLGYAKASIKKHVWFMTVVVIAGMLFSLLATLFGIHLVDKKSIFLWLSMACTAASIAIQWQAISQYFFYESINEQAHIANIGANINNNI